jgi:hypothetical protein
MSTVGIAVKVARGMGTETSAAQRGHPGYNCISPSPSCNSSASHRRLTAFLILLANGEDKDGATVQGEGVIGGDEMRE